MVSKEKVESKSVKWKEKWEKRLASYSSPNFSKFDAKAAKWKNKWGKRQGRFSHNRIPNWNLKWVRKTAKITRKFGKIGEEAGERGLDHFYISRHF